MKKLFLVLCLLALPAYGQEIVPAYTYDVTQTQTTLNNINQQPNALNLVDDGTITLNIGFDFTYFGQTFNTVYISNNGLINFLYENNGCCAGEILPTSSLYDYSIFGLWTDLINIGTINPYYNLQGPQGSQYLTIGWYDISPFYNETAFSTFEITLYEGSNNILLNYGNINTGGLTVTAGLQGNSLLNEYNLLYYGSDANSLSNTSYLFSAYVPPEPPVIGVNCTTNPLALECIIQSINTNSTEDLYTSENKSFTESNNQANEVFNTGSVENTTILMTSRMSQNNSDNNSSESISKNNLENITSSSTVESSTSSSKTVSNNLIISNIDITNTPVEETSSNEGDLSNELMAVDISLNQKTIEENQSSEQNTVQNVSTNTLVNSNNSDLTTELDMIQDILNQSNKSNETFSEQNEDVEFIAMVTGNGINSSLNIIQPFNYDSNMMDKQQAGIFKEEKSDAEKRSEEVVAANAKEQEEISNNYMDADQSGLIGAMSAGVDVASYRNAMLQDLSSWYRPEDIYKNVTYKDNARGMYFLEKGNTDTYNKMVDEQYK